MSNQFPIREKKKKTKGYIADSNGNAVTQEKPIPLMQYDWALKYKHLKGYRRVYC